MKTAYAMTGIKPPIVADGDSKSDRGSFWKQSHPAIMVMEDFSRCSHWKHKSTAGSTTPRGPTWSGLPEIRSSPGLTRPD